MRTYSIRNARTKSTGHLRQDGTRTTYCNRPIGAPNDVFQSLKGWKMCTRCVKAEARDRAHAEEVAAQHAEPTAPATTCGARRPGWTAGPAIGINRIPCTLAPHATGNHRNAFGQTWPQLTDADRAAAALESRQMAELITEAEATDGTWRGEWIGARDTAPTLFALPAADQGALFA